MYECDSYLFFSKQKTAYEMRIRDWSSDVCSSDLTSSCPPAGTTARSPGGGPARTRRRPGTRRDPGRTASAGGRRRVRRRHSGRRRSEERRVGKECDGTCITRVPPYHSKKQITSQKCMHTFPISPLYSQYTN